MLMLKYLYGSIPDLARRKDLKKQLMGSGAQANWLWPAPWPLATTHCPLWPPTAQLASLTSLPTDQSELTRFALGQ